jgi:hypothetical protein
MEARNREDAIKAADEKSTMVAAVDSNTTIWAQFKNVDPNFLSQKTPI